MSRIVEGNCFIPPTNVIETDKFYSVQMAMPGYKREELRLTVENDVLSINADPSVKIDCVRQVHREEFYKNTFHCSLLLPENIHDDRIDAEYSNGILCILIPKTKKPVMITKEIYIK
jgi:HSP20 family protein